MDFKRSLKIANLYLLECVSEFSVYQECPIKGHFLSLVDIDEMKLNRGEMDFSDRDGNLRGLLA